MGDHDRLVVDSQLSFEHYADFHHRQIYSLERYIGPTIISMQAAYDFVEISVNFIEKRPRSALELVFKDDTGVKHESNQFKKGDLVIWNLDMSVHLRCTHSRRPIDFVQAY
jgi:hypothetical protein